MGPFSFGSFVLHDQATYWIDRADPPRADAELHRLGLHHEGSSVPHRRWPEIVVPVRGWFAGASQAATDAARDALLKAIAGPEDELRLGFADSRYWLANQLSYREARAGDGRNPLGMQYVAEFLLRDPFAYANVASQVVNSAALTNIGGSPVQFRKTFAVAVGGSVYTRPYITILMTGSSWDGDELILHNVTTGQRLTVNESVGSGNVFEIDSTNFVVEKSGSSRDYTGQFIVMDPQLASSNTFEFYVNRIAGAGTPGATITFDWRARYL